jgi:MFS family permease
MTKIELRPWVVLFAVSLAAFGVNTGTFTTLGVVMPHMVKEMHWSWTQAGLGFTVLGASVGLSSYFPKLLIRRFGVRATLVAGAASLFIGFFCLSITQGIGLLYLGAALCGAGYQMMAVISGTHVIAMVFKKRSLPLGIYFTFFALGSVCGPFIAMGILHLAQDQWRYVWRIHMLDIVLWASVCTVLIGSTARLAEDQRRAEAMVGPEIAARRSRVATYSTPVDWTLKEAVRTPQFFILAATYMAHTLIAVSVSSLSVPHLTQQGIAAGTAAAMLSLEHLTQTCFRAVGGVLGDWIDPYYVLLAGLAMLSLGPFALSIAHTYPMMLVYALSTGIGSGLSVIAAVVLLINYFGPSHNLEIFSVVSFSGVIAALAPTIGGMLRDHTGSFQAPFQIYAGAIFLIFVATVIMRPPTKGRGRAVSAPDSAALTAVTD